MSTPDPDGELLRILTEWWRAAGQLLDAGVHVSLWLSEQGRDLSPDLATEIALLAYLPQRLMNEAHSALANVEQSV